MIFRAGKCLVHQYKPRKKQRKENMSRLMKMAVAVFAAMATCATLAKSSSDDDDDYDEDSGALTFSMDTDDFPESVGDYYILTEFLPTDISVDWKGNKLTTPKSATPKVKKVDGEYEVVISEKGEGNPCGLKLKYNKKSGKVTGSFKVYATYETKKGKLKLKKYSAKVSGTLDEESALTVRVSKIGTFSATLE